MQVSGVGSKPDELSHLGMVYTIYGDDSRMVMDGLWVYDSLWHCSTMFYPHYFFFPKKKQPNLFEMFAPEKWICNYFFVDEAFWCILKIARSYVMAFGKFEEYALESIEKYRKFKDFPSKAWRKWQSEFLLIAKWYHVFQIPARSAETCWSWVLKHVFLHWKSGVSAKSGYPKLPKPLLSMAFPIRGTCEASTYGFEVLLHGCVVPRHTEQMQKTGKSQGNPGEIWLFYTHLCSNTLHFQYLNILSTTNIIGPLKHQEPMSGKAICTVGSLHQLVSPVSFHASLLSDSRRWEKCVEYLRVAFHDFPWLSMTPWETHDFSNVAQTFQTVFHDGTPGGSASSTGSSFGAWNGRALTRRRTWRRKSRLIPRYPQIIFELDRVADVLSIFEHCHYSYDSDQTSEVSMCFFICYLFILFATWHYLAHCWNSWNLNEHRMPTDAPIASNRSLGTSWHCCTSPCSDSSCPSRLAMTCPINVTVQLVAHLNIQKD